MQASSSDPPGSGPADIPGTSGLTLLMPDQELFPVSDGVMDEELPIPGGGRAPASQRVGSGGGIGPGKGKGALDIGKLEELKVENLPEVKDFMTIDWTYYAEKDRDNLKHTSTSRHKFRSPMVRLALDVYDSIQSWLALALVGVVSGGLAAMIGMGTDWANDLKFGTCVERGFWITREMCCKDSANLLQCPNWKSWGEIWAGGGRAEDVQLRSYVCYVGIAMLQAGYAAWMCKTFAPYAVGSGLGEIKVIMSGFVIKRFLGGWTLLIKSVGLVLAVGSGLSIGKEGPFIHVCVCVANVMCRLFSKYNTNEGRKRELLSSAAAAGVAVAFGAPIGGVLFSLEEVSIYYPAKAMWRSLFCSVVAAMTLQRLNPLSSTGKLVLFEITYHHKWKLFEMGPFLLIGAMGGLVGAILNKGILRIAKLRKTTFLKRFPVTEVVVCSCCTSLICYTIVYLRGSYMRLLSALFSECKNSSQDIFQELCNSENGRDILTFLILSAVILSLLTMVTFGNQAPGGIFVPALCIGALLGRAVGFSMQLLENEIGDVGIFEPCVSAEHCITPGIYAIVGAAAVLGGVTRMTMCLVVILFEVTGGLEYVLPVMVGVMMSKWVGDAFGRDSVYTAMIRLKGYPYLDNKREHHFKERASDVMSYRDLQVLTTAGNTVESLEAKLAESTYQGFPVVTSLEEPLGAPQPPPHVPMLMLPIPLPNMRRGMLPVLMLMLPIPLPDGILGRVGQGLAPAAHLGRPGEARRVSVPYPA